MSSVGVLKLADGGKLSSILKIDAMSFDPLFSGQIAAKFFAFAGSWGMYVWYLLKTSDEIKIGGSRASPEPH